jgi:hypothetical protein
MRRVLLVFVVLSTACLLAIPSPARAQQSRPSDDLAKENAELKQKLKDLQSYVDELEKKLAARPKEGAAPWPRIAPRATPPGSQPDNRIAPPRAPAPSPFRFEIPNPFGQPQPFGDPGYRFQIPPRGPSTRPSPSCPLLPAPAPGQAPKDWQPHEFNGQPYYVIPLH